MNPCLYNSNEKNVNSNNQNLIYQTNGFFLLFLVFLTLKLCNIISWSWWWISAPLWVPISFILCITLVGVVMILISSIFNKTKF